jgi:hypothetical protein
MKLPIDKEWFEKRAAAEGDLEIGVGRRLTSTINLTGEEIAELERLALEALPEWARLEIEAYRSTHTKAPVAWLPKRRWEQMTAAEPWLTNIVYSEDQGKFFECVPLYSAPVDLTEERDRLREENERLRVICRDTQMLAYKWQEAHDCLKAGVPYSFPSPTDLPKCEAENERLRGALKTAAVWLRNGDYDTRGGLIEMDRIAGVCETALSNGGAS